MPALLLQSFNDPNIAHSTVAKGFQRPRRIEDFAGTTLALSEVMSVKFWSVRPGWTETATLPRDVACLPFLCDLE